MHMCKDMKSRTPQKLVLLKELAFSESASGLSSKYASCFEWWVHRARDWHFAAVRGVRCLLRTGEVSRCTPPVDG